jgi:hypothetical protein
MSRRIQTIVTIVAVLVAVLALTARVHVTHSANTSVDAGAEPPTPKGWTPQGGVVHRLVVHTNARGGQIVTARIPGGNVVRGVSCPDGVTYLAGTQATNGVSTTASAESHGGGPTTHPCIIPGVGMTK